MISVLSSFRFSKAEWLKGWKRKCTKMEGKFETEFWRNWHPRDRMDDAIAYQERRSIDAAARLTRPRNLSESHTTQTRDRRDRMIRRTPDNTTAWPTQTRDRGHVSEFTEYAPSDFWSPFWPRSKHRQHRLDVIKWRNASIQGELTNF